MNIVTLNTLEENLKEFNNKIVKKKIIDAVGTVETPFTNAYWKDSVTNKLYLVKIVDGQLNVSEAGDAPITPPSGDDTPPSNVDMSISTVGLDGVLPDRLLIWHDEFDGDSLDLSKWSFAHGYARNGEIHCNDEDHCTLSNSICRITAEPNLVDGVLTPFKIDGDTTHTFKWRCSEFASKFKFSGNFLIEAKIRLIPDTTDATVTTRKGFCPAWWAMGDYNTYEWPYNGEVDWMESPNFNGINSTTHYGDPSGLHKAGWMGGGYPSSIDWSTFHTLAWERKGNDLWYYFDGNITSHKTATEADKEIFFGGVNPFIDFPIGTIANIAVGGTASTSATDDERGTHPCAMDIDWVRVYTNKGVDVCNKPTNLSIGKGFNFDIGNNTWDPTTKTIKMRSLDTVNFVYSHDTLFAPIKIETSTEDNDIAFPCATSGSKVYPQSMGIFGGKEGTTYFRYNESYVDSSDSEKNYSFSDRIKVVVSNPKYTKIDTLLENIDFSRVSPDFFMSGQFTGYSSQIKLNYLQTDGNVDVAMKHMVISRPIKITPGKKYTIKNPRMKTKGAMLFTSGDIVLGTTKFADIRPSSATWTQTTSTADNVTYVKNNDYASITFTAPSDAKYVVFWGGDIDTNNRRWPFTHVIRDIREAMTVECDREEVPCTGITLSDSSLTFTSTQSKTLTATLTPTNTTDTVVWTINNSLATVSDGIVTPVGGDGVAVVTATCGSKSATCTCTFNISGSGDVPTPPSEHHEIQDYMNDGSVWTAGMITETGSVQSSTNRIYCIIPKELIDTTKTYNISTSDNSLYKFALVKYGQDDGSGKYPDVSGLKFANSGTTLDFSFPNNTSDYSVTVQVSKADNSGSLSSTELIDLINGGDFKFIFHEV